MGLGRAYRLGGDFKVMIWVVSHNGMGPFYGGSRHLETRCKDFSLAIGGGLGWMKLLKYGAGKGCIFYAIIPALYSFW